MTRKPVTLTITYLDGSTTVMSGSVDWIDRCLFNMAEEETRRITDWKFS